MNIRSGLLAVLAVSLLFTGIAPVEGATTYVTTLRAGARALPVAAESNAGYDRDRYFGRWLDTNQDCQDTRAEVLIQESKIVPSYTTARRCTVANGRWVTTFDNRTHTSATTVQIDHTVPVHEVWGSGARSWTQARRVAYYNDLSYAGSLNAQTGSLNASKQASGPEQWMPPANHCSYVAQWIAVKTRWGLTVDATEKTALIQIADRCPASSLTITKV
jgi:hypothetical protein